MLDKFEIEKQIYNTQWTNIRHHWEETIKSIRYLSTLILFAIVPLKFLPNIDMGNNCPLVESNSIFLIKVFVVCIIAAFGLLTLLNQYNHNKRSIEARKVVVEIEKSWDLYTEEGRFVYQNNTTDYQYGKFAEGEKRISHSRIQFLYIIVITIAGVVFVLSA